MNITDEIGLITVFLLILLSGFLLLNKAQNRIANALFAFFLLITSFDFSALLLSAFYHQYEVINKFRVASVFLQMPFFYLYVKKTCFYDYQIEWKLLFHIVPFIGFIIIFLTSGINEQIDLWYGIATQAQYYLYMAAVFHVLIRFKKIHDDSHSFKSETYSWLLTASLLFIFGNTLVLLRGVFEALNNYQGLPILNVSISLFGLLVISWFVLKTMRNPELFTSVYLHPQELKRLSNEREREFKKDVDQLTAYMKLKRPYLIESITLPTLAKKTGIPEKKLSFLINKVLGKHFFDFINHYRIEEAKRLLQDEDLNIQQVMFEVGFNSKSSFNTAFKKYTSYTPSDFRKTMI